TAYDIGTVDREIKIANTYVTPGQTAAVPILLKALGTERTFVFSIAYDINPLSSPIVACGSGISGCTLNVDTSMSGRIGVSITSPQPITAGNIEAAKISFQTVATNLSNTPLNFVDQPLQRAVRNSTNDPLQTTFTNGMIVFERGLEGDVACDGPCRTGDGRLFANDVVKLRRLTVGLDTADPTTNEFQRADTSPGSTKGDGQLDATDVVKARRYVANLDHAQLAGGPNWALQFVIGTEGNAKRQRNISLVRQRTSASKVLYSVEFDLKGNEAAVSLSIEYNPSILTRPVVELASGLNSTTALTANTSVRGRIILLADSSSSLTTTGTAKGVFTISFDALKERSDRPDAIGIDSKTRLVLSDQYGNPIPQ
ncbi:MAG: hypothetical protein ABL952_08005, partial [Pyrinomonadaceae bacterium]